MSYLNDRDFQEWEKLTEEKRQQYIKERVLSGDVYGPNKAGFESGLAGSFPSQEEEEEEFVKAS